MSTATCTLPKYVAPKAMPIFPGLIGKVAVVTGWPRGIGAEIPLYLAANLAPQQVFLQSIKALQV